MESFEVQVMPKTVICLTNFSTIAVPESVVDVEEGET